MGNRKINSIIISVCVCHVAFSANSYIMVSFYVKVVCTTVGSTMEFIATQKSTNLLNVREICARFVHLGMTTKN